MLRLITFFILSILPLSALAEQKYLISFQNNSSHVVWVEAKNGNCMHIWNIPETHTLLVPGKTLGPYTIQDKNSGSCINADKTNFWNIYNEQSNNSDDNNNYLSLNFIHKKGDGWSTSFLVDEIGNVEYKVSSVTCNGVICIDPKNYESGASFVMIVDIDNK